MDDSSDNSGGVETPSGKPRDLDPVNDDALIRLAKERFQLCAETEAPNRIEELDDQHFMVGDQWPTDVRHQREQDERPCLTVNKLPQFVRQVTNDQRQNRPSIKVNPCDNKADVDTAKIYQGLIRHIEYQSHADIAYDRAFEYAASSGIGYYRLVTEYMNPMSFQQEICIKQVRDRFSVYMDPFYEEPDGSDAQYGFIFTDFSVDEFKAEHPDSKLASMADWTSIGDNNGLYIGQDKVRVAEYYYKIWVKADIVLLSNQKVVEVKDLPDPKNKKTGGLPDDVRIISRRKTLVPKIKWCKLTGLEVLERTDIPGQWIPIIPVIGQEYIVNGRRILSGIIRDAKDSQRMHNYWVSAETEMIALAPKSPFIVAEGQLEGYEHLWKTANTQNHAYLPYKPKSIGGVPVPAPQRTQFEPQVQAITMARQQSGDDLKAVTGIYDASLGNRSNEESGVAIQRRNHQSQTSNFHYVDNLSRSLRHTGRILLNWIPQIYNTAQAIRIIGDDGQIKFIDINRVLSDPDKGMKSHFLDAGTYDCTVDTGPSYQTKRQEAVASMIDLSRAAPAAMSNALDILVRNMDWPFADLIADRIKRSLPPQLTAGEDADATQKIPPAVQNQLSQMSAMLKQLTQELEASSEIIKTKRLESESKERIAVMEQQTSVAIEYMKHHAEDARLVYETESKMAAQRLETLGINQPVGQGPGDQPPQTQQPSGPAQPGPSTGGQSPGQPMGG